MVSLFPDYPDLAVNFIRSFLDALRDEGKLKGPLDPGMFLDMRGEKGKEAVMRGLSVYIVRAFPCNRACGSGGFETRHYNNESAQFFEQENKT